MGPPRTALRALLILGSAACLIIVAALLLPRLLFPPGKIKALAAGKLQDALGREVRIGTASVGLGAVEMGGIEIAKEGGFKEGVQFAAKSLRAGFLLKPLILERRLELYEVALEGLFAAAAKNSEGRLDLPNTRKDLSGGGAAAGAALPFTVAMLNVKSGSLRYEDKAAGFDFTASSLTLRLANIKPGEPVSSAISFQYAASSSSRTFSGRVDFLGRLSPAGWSSTRTVVDIQQLALDCYGIKTAIKGRLEDSPALRADLQFTVPELGPAQFERFLKLPSWVTVPAATGQVLVTFSSGTLTIEDFEARNPYFVFRASGTLRNAPEASPSLSAELSASLPALTKKQVKELAPALGAPFSLPPSKIEAAASWDAEGLSISSAGIQAGPLALTLRGRLGRGGDAPSSVDFALNSQPASLDELFRAFSVASPLEGLRGKAGADIFVRGSTAALSFAGRVRFSDLSFDLGGSPITRASGAAAFNDRDLKAALKGKWSKEDFTLKLDAKGYKAKRPRLSFDASLKSLDLCRLAPCGPSRPEAPAAEKGKAGPSIEAVMDRGTIRIGKASHPNLNASGVKLTLRFTKVAADPALAEGTVDISAGEGSFTDLRVFADASPTLQKLLLPITMLQKAAKLVNIAALPAYDRVKFSKMTGRYELSGGMLTLRDTRLTTDQADVRMSGTVDLAKGSLDLAMENKLKGKVGQTVSAPITFTVTESTSNPKVRMKLSSIFDQPVVKKAIDDGQKRLMEEGGKLLRGIFK